VFVENGVVAAATSQLRLHGRGGLIALRLLRHAQEQGIRIGAIVTGGKELRVAELEHRVTVVE